MPRLRLIAGPNGSGKTTLIRTLVNNKIPVGQYINPDDIARHVCLSESLIRTGKILNTGSESMFPQEFELSFAAILAQTIAQGLRKDWLTYQLSLTYESVMSHESHLSFVDDAINAGFAPYLYYICTSDPDLNKARVKQRVTSGGHDVPEGKILSRYHNSLKLLLDMVKRCHRVYFFDNSGSEQLHFAEVTPDGYLDIFEKQFNRARPSWFIENLLLHWGKNKIRLAAP